MARTMQTPRFGNEYFELSAEHTERRRLMDEEIAADQARRGLVKQVDIDIDGKPELKAMLEEMGVVDENDNYVDNVRREREATEPRAKKQNIARTPLSPTLLSLLDLLEPYTMFQIALAGLEDDEEVRGRTEDVLSVVKALKRRARFEMEERERGRE
jgi:hypothetical protein